MSFWMSLISGLGKKNQSSGPSEEELAEKRKQAMAEGQQRSMNTVQSGGVADNNSLAAGNKSNAGGDDREQRRQRWRNAGSSFLSSYLNSGRENQDTGFGS